MLLMSLMRQRNVNEMTNAIYDIFQLVFPLRRTCELTHCCSGRMFAFYTFIHFPVVHLQYCHVEFVWPHWHSFVSNRHQIEWKNRNSCIFRPLPRYRLFLTHSGIQTTTIQTLHLQVVRLNCIFESILLFYLTFFQYFRSLCQ